jgi:hypothetical protein
MTADGRSLPFFEALGKNSFFRSMSTGLDWYQRITLDPAVDTTVTSVLAILGLVVMATSALILIFSTSHDKLGRFAGLCIGLSVCSFALYPAFKGLNRPWHFYVLTPLFICCCTIAAVHCLTFLKQFQPIGLHASVLFAIVLAAGVGLAPPKASACWAA